MRIQSQAHHVVIYHSQPTHATTTAIIVKSVNQDTIVPHDIIETLQQEQNLAH
jgi:hypothetical protein